MSTTPLTISSTVTLSNGVAMPRFGLGTWQSKPGEVAAAVAAALDAGYCAIDCAQIYGNQSEIGEVFANYFTAKPSDSNSEGKPKRNRSDVFVTSKLWVDAMQPAQVRPAAERILRELQLTQLELLLIHWPVVFASWPPSTPESRVKDADLLDTWKAMEALVDLGLVRCIGVSNFGVRHLEHLLRGCRIPPVVNQVELHPYLPQHKLLRFCAAHNIQLTAYSPLGSGRGGLLEDPAVVAIGQAHGGKSGAQVLIRWALQRPTIVIPKSVHRERIEANANVFDFELSAPEMATLDGLYKQVRRERFVDPTPFFKLEQSIFAGDEPTDD